MWSRSSDGGSLAIHQAFEMELDLRPIIIDDAENHRIPSSAIAPNPLLAHDTLLHAADTLHGASGAQVLDIYIQANPQGAQLLKSVFEQVSLTAPRPRM